MNRTSVRMLVRRGSIRSLAEGSYEPALAMFVRYAELTFPAPGRCRGSIMIPGLGGTPSLPTRAGAGSRPSSDATLSTGRRWRSRISRSAALRRTPGRQPGPPPDPRAGRQRPLRQPGRPHGPHGAGTIRSQDDYEHTKRRPSARGPVCRRPLTWTKDPDHILATIRRAKARAYSLTNHQPCCLCSAKRGRPCFSPA